MAIQIIFELKYDYAKRDLGTIAAECSANLSSLELVNKNSKEALNEGQLRAFEGCVPRSCPLC